MEGKWIILEEGNALGFVIKKQNVKGSSVYKGITMWLNMFGNIGGGGLVTKLRLTLFDPLDWSRPGSSVHGISQALEWVAISFSNGNTTDDI